MQEARDEDLEDVSQESTMTEDELLRSIEEYNHGL
jgi:hypothetical protein